MAIVISGKDLSVELKKTQRSIYKKRGADENVGHPLLYFGYRIS